MCVTSHLYPARVRHTEFKPPQGGFIIWRNMKQKVIVYVDGYNFYYGLRNGKAQWRRAYWLDVVEFFERMMQADQELVEVNYYSSRPVDDPQAYDNQDEFFSANKLNPKFKLHLGRYKKKKFKCQNCGFRNKTYEEKETDVHVATGMLVDVFLHRCDVTIIVSADSDMIPSVEAIKSFAPQHPVIAFIPPTQHSYALVGKCDTTVYLEQYRARFMQALLPEEIAMPNGHILHCPSNWK